MTIVNNVESEVWVSRAITNPQAKLRLFVFPYAGAGTAVFRTWVPGLSNNIEFCPIRLPGRETRIREPLFTRLTPLVETLANALSGFLDKPFAFYGHSMGALVAFETARHLRCIGQPMPQHLLVSARRAPQIPDPDSPMHLLSDSAFIKEMQRRYDGIPAAILQTPELLDLFLPVLKADFSVIETYQYTVEAPLDCPIAVFGGTQDHVLRAGDLEGWQAQTNQAFTLQKFVGGHFFIQSQQAAFIAAVSRTLASYT